MALKAWREIAVPHEDIRRGGFDESTFAADLADVLFRRGPLEYRDPKLFFRKTYPTAGMVKLLAAVLRRLATGQGGEPVIQIQTPFGGGKTHSLVALYHLFRSGRELPENDLVQRTLREAGVERIPQVAIAVFVGTAADPLGRTPWGELAAQLERYDLLEAHDRARQTPGKSLLIELLNRVERPILLLMDEIAHYAAKCVDPKEIEGRSLEAGRAYQTQVLTFFQELTEAVKVSPRAALVMTLPSSAPYGEEGERALLQLQRITGRMEAVYEPVRGWEIYDILRTRLFESIGDGREIRRVADRYVELYQQLGSEVPEEMREPSYRDRIRRAYPFHPQLVDLLFERWGTLSTFQRTRGVLRFLAEVVADLYRREHPAPLIQPAHVDLANAHIRRELVRHTGNEFDSVIAADIANSEGSAKAQRIDREIGSEYARFQVASSLATAIFLHSFSSSSRNGASLPQLRVALLREALPPALIGDTLHRLSNTLWYLHHEAGLYFFSTRPNLNRMLVDREGVIDEPSRKEELHRRLKRLSGQELKVYLAPSSPEEVPDTRALKLVVLSSPDETFAHHLLERVGATFRVYKNTLVVLMPEASALVELDQLARRHLALRSLYEDQRLFQRLSEADQRLLKERLKESDGALDQALLRAWRHLYKLGGEGLERHDLGLPTVGERATLAKRVRDFLVERELLLTRIAPRHLLTLLGEGESEKSLMEIDEAYLRYPDLPMLEDRSVLERAICRGVEEGRFGLRLGDQIFFKRPLPEPLPWEEAVLLRPPVSAEETGAKSVGSEEPIPPPAPQPESATGSAFRDKEASDDVEGKSQRVFELTCRLPWNRLADFARGVLVPLQTAGAEIDLQLRLKATAEEGLSRELLDRIEETLRQLGIRDRQVD